LTARENLPIAVWGRIVPQGTGSAGELTVDVSDETTKNKIAQFTCSGSDGRFPLEVSYPGIYTFTIQSPGADPMTARIEITEDMNGSNLNDIIFTPGGLMEIQNPLASNRRNGATDTDYHDDTLQPSGSTGSTIETNAVGTLASKDDKVTATGDISSDVTVFKVQIGAFRVLSREVIKQRLEQMTDVNMLTSHSDNAWLRFYFGEEDSYESAHNLRNTLKLAGFEDAFVAAFRNDQPVNIREALGQSQPLADSKDE